MLSIYILWILSISSVLSLENSGTPEFDLVSLSDGYHGIVDEGHTIVDVQPKIRATPNVCSFTISSKRHGEAPFSIHLRDAELGEAELVARGELNCEQRKNYKFDIVAISCDSVVSQNVTVRVKVNDVNEFAPSFSEPSYVATVDEGRLYGVIASLRAEDQDCSAKYGDVCRYEILSDHQPFAIDGEGSLRNTEELDYEKSHNHILSVVAYDCGMKKSLPVIVTVRVNKMCHLGWKGIPKRISYTPGSGRQELFPSASLDLCGSQCDVERVESRVSLETNHIGKGCDRDTFSVPAQRKICGASDESYDLLPSPGPDTEWTSGLLVDDGTEGDLIYSFTGDSSAVEVPVSLFGHDLSNTFTLSTWMKHKAHSTDKHLKEHILCGADEHKMNRHHFAFFVRNCKLILLVRREYNEVDLNTFQPAEWRWKLPQACDNEWHHYSVQAKLPSVVLFVDGHLFHPEQGDSPEVIDDWPLHPTKGIDIKVSVGGCWQGSEGVMKHGLTGYLAGLSVLKGSQEETSVLGCITRCQESLDTPAMELLQPRMELLSNKEMNQITIEGDNVTNLETLLKKVAYMNSRENPTPGKRPISLSTNILCSDGRAVKAVTSESFIVVQPSSNPVFQLDGTTNYGAEYERFRQGLRIFPDLKITLSDSAAEGKQSNIFGKLDECSVTLYPPLNFDHEALSWPDVTPLISSVSREGASLKGLATLEAYQDAIRTVKYSNRKPAYYLNRDFKLRCQRQTTISAGRYESNEYIQRVTVIHPEVAMNYPEANPVSNSIHKNVVQTHPKPAHAQVSVHHVGIKKPRVVTTVEGATPAGAGHAATLIVVVSIGFVIFLLALAAVRARSVRSRNLQENADTEMAWDDSSLNITVNPMEMNLKETQKLREDDEDSNSGDSNYDESDSSDEEAPKPKELEWDHSTLLTM